MPENGHKDYAIEHLTNQLKHPTPGTTPGRTAFSSVKTEFRDAAGRVWPSRLEAAERPTNIDERAAHGRYGRLTSNSTMNDQQKAVIFCNRISVNKIKAQEN